MSDGFTAKCGGPLASALSRLVLAGLLAALPAASYAQRVGLWESQVSLAGRPVGEPIRSCIKTADQLRMLNDWPANCSAIKTRKTHTGLISGARCRNASSEITTFLQREVSGDLNHRYSIFTRSRVEGLGTQPTQESVLTSQYLGSCVTLEDGGTKSNMIDKSPVSGIKTALAFVLQSIAISVLLVGSLIGLWPLFQRRGRGKQGRKIVADIAPCKEGETVIPVIATFTGVRGLTWWYAVAMNNANPSLVLQPGGIRFRVVRQSERPYADIEHIDVREAKGTVNLDFTFRGYLLTFTANLGSLTLVAHVLSLLPTSVPLSARAIEVKAGA